MHVLILGGGSGIGKALTEFYLAQGAQLSVFSRQQTPACSADPSRLRHYPYLPSQLEQADPALQADLQQVFSTAPQLVFCCLGMLHQDRAGPEKTIQQLSAGNLRQSFELNSILPALWLQQLWPYLPQTPQVKLCWLSAKVGSITDNQSGGWYSYRSSKAALNMLVRCAALEMRRRLPHAVLVALHPGTTDTALSAPFQRNLPAGQLQSPAQTAARLAETVAALTTAQHGALINWDGIVLPY